MSDPFPQAVDSYEYLKQQQNLDFFSFLSPTDIVAPHPDLFESDIDSNLAPFIDHLQLYTVDSNDAYNFFRTEKPQWQGPLSTITVSSDSYDSESFYNEQQQQQQQQSVNLNPDKEQPPFFDFSDLDMDFQRVTVGSDYSAVSPTMNIIDDTGDYVALPPTPPTSPPTALNLAKVFDKPYSRPTYSDYSSPRRRSLTTSDYYSIYAQSQNHHPTVSPSHISPQLPAVPAVSLPVEEVKDPRKKYKCTACPRAFARAYNLKTHMATHDPNRLKPYICSQRSCGRSFSRKHDLGRHLISIHRDESISASLLPGSKKQQPIGVQTGTRSWCESCGKGYVGRTAGCHCADVK